MDNETFFMIAEKFFDNCLDISKKKGEEFTVGSGKKFTNFESIAARLDWTREKVLMVYLEKHIDSIRHFILHGTEASDEKIDGRILDAVNYLVLLYGMLYETEYLKQRKITNETNRETS